MTQADKNPMGDVVYLYQDDDLLALSKPAWLLSVPGRGKDKIDSLTHRVQQQFPEALTVHRLDWATSGVMIMARHLDAQRQLNRQFEQRKTQKRYIAVVAGKVEKPQQSIALPLRCDWENRPRQIVDWARGKSALTHVSLIEYEAKSQQTRLLLQPVTGRSHQLRVHCQQIGHPIIGDRLYASPVYQKASPRLLLHAEWLQVYHPNTGKPITFFDPCPF